MKREPGTVQLFRIAGIPVFVHWSVLVCGALLYWFAKPEAQATGGLLVSYVALIAIHEAAHAFAATSVGLKVFSISISGVGGLCRFQTPTSYGPALLVSSAGLMIQLVLLISTIAALSIFGAPTSTFSSYFACGFTYVNGAMIVLNLIPAKRQRSHLGTDGFLLWTLSARAFRKQPFAWPDTSATFPPETNLGKLKGFKPEGFENGIEILNDNQTPMDFVVNTLAAHLKVPRDEAIKLMLTIHERGGLMIALPSHDEALAVADGISKDSAVNGHKLVCRAVGAQQGVPADGLASLGRG
ncbi:MAG: ATP-dependent Clp protease adaptor ClpS [Planctomycetes bacterium]|nr:ATP-dependent Clp protease adaptor ClpS [Planctomycetota bacterium]